MIRLGIIGLGKMGTYHARCAQELEQSGILSVTHLVDTHVHEQLPISGNNRIVTQDYRDALGSVDAVIIATPTPTHFTIASDFIRHNAHVLLEKPIAPTLEEAQELHEQARVQKKMVMMGFVERHNPAFRYGRDLLPENPSLFHALRLGPFNPRVAHDSVVLDLMIHDIDLIQMLAPGEIVERNVSGERINSSNIDVAHVHQVYQDGRVVTITASRNHDGVPTRSCQISNTSNSKVVMNFQSRNIEGATALHQSYLTQNPLLEQLKTFCACIQDERYHSALPHDLAVHRDTLEIEKAILATL